MIGSRLKRWWQKRRRREALLRKPWPKVRFVVMDLELTGLDPKCHEIVSLAWLPIVKGRIRVEEAGYGLNREVNSLEQSPVFHGLDSVQLAKGKPLKDILLELSQQLKGAVWVFHNAPLDLGFLLKAFAQHGIELAPDVVADTLLLEKKNLLRKGQEIALDSLTLGACRARYDLPEYPAHNALSDAFACAELLLAQLNSAGRSPALKSVL